MLYYIYYGSLVILVPGIIFSIIAQIKIRTSYAKYSRVHARSGISADSMSRRFISAYDLTGVTVQPIKGELTDNYNPKNDVLSLSQGVFGSDSIAALGVAAHECGHACQKRDGSFMLALRSILVPVTNIGSRLAVPVAVLGVLLEWMIGGTGENFGSYVVAFGILLYSLTSIFALVTLPVEFNASHRALKMLNEQGVLESDELRGARKVLSAAAMTYVASLIISLLYLLRFIAILGSVRKRDK